MKRDTEARISHDKGGKAYIRLSLQELEALLNCEYAYGVKEARKELFSKTDKEIIEQKQAFKGTTKKSKGEIDFSQGLDAKKTELLTMFTGGLSTWEELAPKPTDFLLYDIDTKGEGFMQTLKILKQLREENGITQNEISPYLTEAIEEAGYTKETFPSFEDPSILSKYEDGKIQKARDIFFIFPYIIALENAIRKKTKRKDKGFIVEELYRRSPKAENKADEETTLLQFERWIKDYPDGTIFK